MAYGIGRVIREDDTTLVVLYKDVGYVRKTVKPRYNLDILARWLCAREVKALKKVRGLNGLQQLVEQDSEASFVSKYAKGIPLYKAKDIPHDYFDKLKVILAGMHERGVADLDFARPKDWIIDPNGNPIVIDLGAAVIYEPRHGIKSILMKPIFDYICKSNYRYMLKRKLKFLPNEMTQEEVDEAHKISILGAIWKSYKVSRGYLKYQLGLTK